MIYVVGGRGTGKTLAIIRIASEKDLIIVVPNELYKRHLLHLARTIRAKIREPITLDDIRSDKTRGISKEERHVAMDDTYDFRLMTDAGFRVEAFSINYDLQKYVKITEVN